MKAVIFDHDGTLVDSEGTHHKMWVSVLEPWGIHFPLEDYINQHAGIPTLSNAERLFNSFTLPVDNYQTLCKIKEQAIENYLSHAAFPLLPYVKETLAGCQQSHLKMGIATGASQTEVFSTLTSHQLADFFATVVSRDQVKQGKPAPDAYLIAAANLDVEPHECIAIEDSKSGVTSAKAAGTYCIAIPNVYSVHHDLSAADIVLPDLRSALEHIRHLISTTKIA